ncbi:MAG: hypothetical protein IPG50_13125 [Myxococcales bacterium]|nr:hypothetical protein [Myxococcales bacterium]
MGERHGKVDVGADVQPLEAGVFVVGFGEKEEGRRRDRAGLGANAAGDPEAVDVRQLNVADDAVGVARARGLEARASLQRHLDGITLRGQRLGEPPGDPLIGLDDEDRPLRHEGTVSRQPPQPTFPADIARARARSRTLP